MMWMWAVWTASAVEVPCTAPVGAEVAYDYQMERRGKQGVERSSGRYLLRVERQDGAEITFHVRSDPDRQRSDDADMIRILEKLRTLPVWDDAAGVRVVWNIQDATPVNIDLTEVRPMLDASIDLIIQEVMPAEAPPEVAERARATMRQLFADPRAAARYELEVLGMATSACGSLKPGSYEAPAEATLPVAPYPTARGTETLTVAGARGGRLRGTLDTEAPFADAVAAIMATMLPEATAVNLGDLTVVHAIEWESAFDGRSPFASRATRKTTTTARGAPPEAGIVPRVEDVQIRRARPGR